MHPTLTYPEALVTGLIQGVTELFPISSLGHNVLVPALAGGNWAKDLSVSAKNSPYLAFIVGLHVATAIAMIAYFWRDWLRIITGFFTSLAHFASPAPGSRRLAPQTTDQQLAWMIILGTIPVGIAGLALDKVFTKDFAKPEVAAIFLAVNGLVLFGGEILRRRRAMLGERQQVADRQMATVGGPHVARHSSGQRLVRQQEASLAAQSDQRLVSLGYRTGVLLGASQILALLPGISRDGIVMVSGMLRGVSRRDAARFSFLLSAPVIFAAGVLKAKDLLGPASHGIHGPILAGSLLSGIAAYITLRFLDRYLSNPARTLTPFAVYCLLAGIGSALYLA